MKFTTLRCLLINSAMFLNHIHLNKHDCSCFRATIHTQKTEANHSSLFSKNKTIVTLYGYTVYFFILFCNDHTKLVDVFQSKNNVNKLFSSNNKKIHASKNIIRQQNIWCRPTGLARLGNAGL